jgi:hypothetical protein
MSRHSRLGTSAPPRILVVRHAKVILDEDLAAFYGVTTGQLNQAVKRNARRFPRDFAFQLSKADQRNLKSQFVISSTAHGGRRTAAWVFTEHGAIMAATLLNTPRAIQMSVFVVRAFVRLRETIRNHAELAAQLAKLEQRVSDHDGELQAIIDTLRKLLNPPVKLRPSIGFSSSRAVEPTDDGTMPTARSMPVRARSQRDRRRRV